MKKRLVSFLLVLVMVLGMLPTVAFAEETTEPVHIKSADDFADKMKDTGSYILDADIKELTKPYSGTFKGTFDGNGHTITLNISGDTTGYVGLFKQIYGGAKIMNLTIAGSIQSTKGNLGGIAGQANPSTANISIQNCKNTANITGGGRGVGGIVGYSSVSGGTYGVVIENCANTGAISASSQAGGIAGNLEGSGHRVTNCYNKGAITAKSAVAGICGRAARPMQISNCYTVGTIPSGGYALVGSGSSSYAAATISNSYALQGCGTTNLKYTSGITANKCDFKSEADMKSGDFVKLLGEDSFMAVPGDYPALKWEIPAAVLTATLDNRDAVFTITKGEDTFYTGEGENHTVSLPEGDYAWTAVCEGYITQDGKITVTAADAAAAKPISVDVKFVEDPTAPKVTSISVKEDSYKAVYKQGDKLNDALVLVLHYDNDTTKEVTKGYTVTGFDSVDPHDALELTVEFEKYHKIFTTTFTVTVKEVPDVFKAIRSYADTITYGHNTNYKGETGKEFEYDFEEGALQSRSQGMSSAWVWVSIKLNNDAPAGDISFQYKVDAEANLDYMQVGTAYKSYTSTDWKKETFRLKPGEELKLTFRKNYDGDKGKDCLWLKDFTFDRLYSITLTTEVEGASLSLADADGNTLTATNGKYTVTPGTYTYTATAFGYQDKTGTITVTDQDVTEQITLTQLPSRKVTFELALPEGVEAGKYTIAIEYDGKTVRTLTDGNTTQLPMGDYTYTVSYAGCDDAKGSFTVKAAVSAVVSVQLTRQLAFGDFFADCKGVTADQGYGVDWTLVKDDAGNYLESTTRNGQRNYLNIEAEANVILSFDVLPYVFNSSNTLTIKKTAGGKTETLKTYANVSSSNLAWENFSVSLKAGEKLMLDYYAPRWDASDYYVHLRNFQTIQLGKVEFTGVIEDAKLTVTDESGKTYEPENGAFYLPAGKTYTYTAAKYGCKPVSGSFEIAAGEEKSISVPALAALATREITFNVTPDGAALTLTHELGGALTANEGTTATYTLYEGETYTYTVSKSDYRTKTGSFTVSDDETITIALTYAGEGWDGEAKTQPGYQNGAYQIADAAQLAWFAEQVNSSSAGINAVLTQNINLNGKTWTPIGTSTNSYAGTFDGQNHLVSGLTGASGLFDSIAAAGTVKNLNVSGTISNTGYKDMGMLANISAGTIENCFTSGTVTQGYVGTTTGGLVGRGDAGSVIRSSGSTATVKNTKTPINSSLNIGGLAGCTYGTVENCYATGDVITTTEKTGNRSIGGLVGQAEKSAVITNSYATGSVSGSTGGFGAFVGTNNGSITGGYYREGAAPVAVASGSASGTRALTESYMKSKDFIKNELGMALYHMDTDAINGGYPVLSWQGGSAVDVSADEKALMEDLQAVQICDLELAKTAQKMREAADAEIDEMFAESSLSMINEFIQDNLGYADGKIRTWEEARIIFQAAFYEAYEAEYLETTGKEIDLFNLDGHLTPDNDGVYHITESTRLSFTAAGENGSKITWSSNSAALDAGNGLVTPPKTGTATVKLTATASMNGASKSRSMTVLIYSAQSDAAKTLSEIAQKLSTWGTYVQPVQIRGHENAADALKFWLYENGYENGYDDEGITVTFKAPGKITYGMSEGKSYLAEDGKVTYYQGENSECKYVVYDGATFELSVNGATQEVTAQVRIGWDIEKAIELMQSALDTELTWEKIKGENENNASPSNFKDETGKITDNYTVVVVNGEVTKKLVVPQTVTVDGVAIQVGFAVLPSSAVTYQFTENNTIEITPRRVPKGTKDKTFDLQLVTLFDANLDDYTIDAMKNQSDDTTSALQVHNALRITCAEETEDTQSVISKNLEELLPGLITNYYDYGAAVNLAEPVKDDLLIPRLYKMEDAGIFEDYSSKMQDVESLTPNVAEVNGYHITVYRPLPGEEPATAQIRIAIHKRDQDEKGRSKLGEKLGEMTLTFMVEPLTQAEISEAKALMEEVTKEDFYWNAIKGENTDRNHITSSLNPFYKVVKNENGEFSYLKSGETEWHIEGIYTDDHPGYDPMQVYGATYRTYYSSRHDVLSYEQLLLTQPEYNTKVEISSWLTYTQYAKYYEKFVVDTQTPNADYKQFETFYKHKVSTTVTVNGTSGKDETEKPNPEGKDVTAYVTLDAKGAKGDGTDKVFASTSSVYADDDGKYEITVKDNGDGVTVANVMEAFFKETDYTSEAYISEYGAYIYSITDPNGVTLAGGTDERPYSGWMYKISGDEHPDSINLVFVQPYDDIYFYYTENYLKDLDPNSPEYEPYKVLIEDVENKVKAIPDEITLDNAAEFEKAYTIARNAYNDLDEGIREYLLDASVSKTLDAKQAMLEAFQKEHSAADVVTAMIAKLPEPSQVTAGDRAAVEKAYNAYIALTAAEMKNISEEDRQKLMDCRQALEGLDETADIMQSLRDTLAEIQNEKDVRASEERFVAAAADIYNNQLTKQQQKQAKKEYTLLKAAQKSLAANIKAADKVKDLITKKLTGEAEALTLKERSTVNSVEKSYEKLSDGAKTFLTGTSEKDTYDAFITQRDYLNENEREIKANEAAAEAVEKQIKKLPKTVKLTDSDKIDAARAAYDALTAAQKALVTNYATLTAAEEKYAALVEANKTELQKADEARELIAKLPETVVYNHVSKEHEAQIKQARAAYDALGKVGKDYVGKDWLKVLKNAEKALKKAVAQDTKDQKAAGKLAQKIAKLPEAELVVSRNEKAIKAARAAYVKLTDNAKLYADELTYKLDDTDKLYMTKLSECEEELHKVLDEEAEAEAVEALIKKLPTAKKVTEEDREDVWDALQAYNALSEKQQTLMVASKYVKKLMECCKELGISTEGDGGDIDLTALELAQAEAVEQAAIIERFVLAEDEDDETLEEAFDDTLDDELDANGD